MTAAELFVECLENEGITHIFGVPGEENEDFLLALQNSKIEFIPTRHEQGAAFIANVWGRITGKTGVCLSTLGPGATNLLTGLADAYLDKAPVLAITGQGAQTRLHHESHQVINIQEMMKPISKWNTSVQDPAIIPEIVRKAIKIAEMEKPGTTHIELPEDIASQEIASNITLLSKAFFRYAAPHPDAIQKALSYIRGAKKPIILAGNGAIRNRASEALTNFSKNLNIPVVSTFMGKGAVSDHEVQSLGTIGLGFKDYIQQALDQADCVVTVGYDIAEYDPARWNSGVSKRIIHIDFAPAEVYDQYIPDLELIGDLAFIIQEILSRVTMTGFKSWYKDIRNQIRKSIQSYEIKDDDAFTVPGVINIVRKILPDNGLVISDVGSHKMWIARNFLTYCPNGCIISNGLASMGISLPGGIAASFIDKNRAVISMMGDGGALMNIQELETAKRLGVAFTCIIFNDNNYGLIEWKQKRNTGKSFGTTLGNPDFKKLAESFGINGYSPQSVKQLKQILNLVIKERQMAVIEIKIDPAVNEELTSTLDSFFN